MAPIGAQTQSEVEAARAEREQVRDQAAEVADQIDALGDEAEDLVIKLDLLEITISAGESRLEVAEGKAASTAEELARVEAEIVELQAARGEIESVLVDSAVEQYVTGHQREQRTVLSADDPVDWSLRQGMYALVVSDLATVRDRLRAIDIRLAEAHIEALDLEAAAQLELDEVSVLTADANAAKATQAQVLGKVQERLDSRLAEAEALAGIDAELSEQIRRGEEEIARRLAIAEALANWDGGPSDGTSRKDRIARPDDIVNVRGIDIHYTLADQLLGLINAAESSGIILGGSGWRGTEHQIELRMQNCGRSDYLIFDAPAEACYPPTARPATSNHEAGKAVDFTAGGRAVVDRNSDSFQWLAANAPRFGFYNLWSEPWHWSVDGR